MQSLPPYLNQIPFKHFKSRPLAYIDFEFQTNLTVSPYPKVICVAWYTKEVGGQVAWLLGDEPVAEVLESLQNLTSSHTLVAHFGLVELLCLEALGVSLEQVQTIDTHAEWSLLTNRYEFNWGRQLQNGRVVTTRPPVDKKEKERLQELSDAGRLAQQNFGSAQKSLAAFVFKFTDLTIDTAHKDQMQQLCIHGTDKELRAHKTAILDYCLGDVMYLKAGYEAALKDSKAAMVLGTEVAAMERGWFTSFLHLRLYVEGIPVDLESLKNLGQAVEEISLKLKARLVKDTGLPFYRGKEVIKIARDGKPTKSSKNLVGTEDQNVLQDYIGKHYPNWPQTDTGKFSTEADVLELYRFDKVVEAYYQCRKSLRSVSALNPVKADGAKKDSYLLDNVTPDGRLRCFFGCFGTQTGRNAPKASVFVLAMSKWLRSFLKPPEGYAIVEADYASQESLLAGIIYEDRAIVEGYLSGDPYLAFGKQAGLIPEGYDKAQTEEEFPGLRAKLKAIVLGKSYGMGTKMLAMHLAAQTWEGASSPDRFSDEWEAHQESCLEDAREFDLLYNEAYNSMFHSREDLWQDFEYGEQLPIARDWALGPEVFKLSALNAPVQGLGARIMRTFTHMLLTESNPYGVRYFSPLHDASFSLVPIEYLKEGTNWIVDRMLNACYREVVSDDIHAMRVGVTIICPEQAGQVVEVEGVGKVTVTDLLIENASCLKVREELSPYWDLNDPW